MLFGFTNDTKEYERVCAYRDAARADGWRYEATYDNEAIERASHLYRDGFVMSILTRSRENEVLNPSRGINHSMHGKWRYEAQIAIWGPDGLAIAAGQTYNWEQITAGQRKCSHCGATDVPTERVGFAGRVCANCAPAERKRIEVPGWCD